MAKRSKVHPTHKRRYRVTNWPSYDRALAERGSLTVWFSPEAVKAWTAGRTGQRGGQRRYSDLAAELRRPAPSGPIDLIVDASGLKVFGQGEWAAARYGGRPMEWRKLHLAVDQAGSIVAVELTDNNVADATVFRTLLDQTDGKVVRLTGDGAYDRREVYESAGRRGAYVVVPPQRGAVVSADPTLRTRNRHIKRIAPVGRAQWRREKKQHQQARAETAFYRFKRCFGSAIRARDSGAQRVEVMTACNLLNWMSSLGRAVSQRLAA